MNKISLLWCEAQKECQKGFSQLGGCIVTCEEKGSREEVEKKCKEEYRKGM